MREAERHRIDLAVPIKMGLRKRSSAKAPGLHHHQWRTLSGSIPKRPKDAFSPNLDARYLNDRKGRSG